MCSYVPCEIGGLGRMGLRVVDMSFWLTTVIIGQIQSMRQMYSPNSAVRYETSVTGGHRWSGVAVQETTGRGIVE